MIRLLSALALILSLSNAGQAGDMKHGMDEHATQHGDLVLKGAFTRETLPNQPVAGAFLTITNNGTEDDVLIAVSSPVAGRGEVHEMKMDGDTMKMREMADGLPIPAGDTVTLEPGGYHLMFMKLEKPMVEGETVEATLVFRKAGEVTMTFTVMGKAARGHGHGGHGS